MPTDVLALPTDGTPFTSDGNPFSEGWGPLFPKRWSPYYQGIGTPLPREGTPFPRDGNRSVSGWKWASIDIFNESEVPHAVVGPMRQRSGGRPNASPLRFKSLHEQGGRIPTCRQRLNSRSHDLTFSHCSSCSVRLIPHLTPYVFRDPATGLTRHIAPAGEKNTVLLPYRRGGLLPIPGHSGRGPRFLTSCFRAALIAPFGFLFDFLELFP